MPQFRKKPVIINAWHIPDEQTASATPGICTGGLSCPKHGPEGSWPHVHTLEGDHTWTPADWLIEGVKGERYFCKPDIFADTYDAVPEATRAPWLPKTDSDVPPHAEMAVDEGEGPE